MLSSSMSLVLDTDPNNGLLSIDLSSRYSDSKSDFWASFSGSSLGAERPVSPRTGLTWSPWTAIGMMSRFDMLKDMLDRDLLMWLELRSLMAVWGFIWVK